MQISRHNPFIFSRVKQRRSVFPREFDTLGCLAVEPVADFLRRPGFARKSEFDNLIRDMAQLGEPLAVFLMHSELDCAPPFLLALVGHWVFSNWHKCLHKALIGKSYHCALLTCKRGHVLQGIGALPDDGLEPRGDSVALVNIDFLGGLHK